jgi:hypothetical protein
MYMYTHRCLGWCKELGLKTIIDLHGAPGVQNGAWVRTHGVHVMV